MRPEPWAAGWAICGEMVIPALSPPPFAGMVIDRSWAPGVDPSKGWPTGISHTWPGSPWGGFKRTPAWPPPSTRPDTAPPGVVISVAFGFNGMAWRAAGVLSCSGEQESSVIRGNTAVMRERLTMGMPRTQWTPWKATRYSDRCGDGESSPFSWPRG